MSRATIRGAELAYDVVDSGTDVVLLHSSLADRRMWDLQLPILTPRHRVMTLDLRGFGDSSLPEGEFSLSADVAELMAYVGMRRAVVVGSSMGGGVAIDLAIERPGLVRLGVDRSRSPRSEALG